jgi:hypothetical protein
MAKRRRSDSDIVHVNVRIPEALRRRLELIAIAERRSLNNVIGVMLDQAATQYETSELIRRLGPPDEVQEGVRKGRPFSIQMWHGGPTPEQLAKARERLAELERGLTPDERERIANPKKEGNDDKTS